MILAHTDWALLIRVVVAVFGGIVVLGAYQMATLVRFRRRGLKASGLVVEVTGHAGGSPSSSDRNVRMYSTRVSYTVDGRDYEIDLPMTTAPAFYTEGEALPVYYLVEAPERGRVVCLREYLKWGILLIASLAVIGGILLASRLDR